MRACRSVVVSTIAVFGMASVAIGCGRPETFLEELQREQPLIVARTTLLEWKGPNGWAPLPYETADDGTWWIPETIATRLEGSLDSLEKEFGLRVTLEVEQWLLPPGSAPPARALPKTVTFVEDTGSAQINWQSRFLATLRGTPLEWSARPIASGCNTPRCNEREIDAALRLLPLLDPRGVEPRGVADWAVEVALDDDIWLAGLESLQYSSLPVPETFTQPDENPREIHVIQFVSAAAVDRLARAALEERGLSPRFQATLALPFEKTPRELVVAAIERVSAALSRTETDWQAAFTTLILASMAQPRCSPADAVVDDEGIDCPVDPVQNTVYLSLSLGDDDPKRWPLLRHAWAELVRSGRLGQVDVPAEWWRPDIIAEIERSFAPSYRSDQEADVEDDAAKQSEEEPFEP